MTIRSLLCLLVAVGVAIFSPRLRAESRIALVMGVGDYDGKFGLTALPGIGSDVTRMKAALTAVGFTVRVVQDPTLSEAESAIDAFGADLKANKGIGLFYYSGHGGEFEGKNYLIPRGARIGSARDVRDQAVNAQRVLNRMEDAGNGTNILFLDCCRNDMTKATTDSGMAAMNAKGTFIGFATASEKTAAASTDGSPYTIALAKFMPQKGISITDMHTMVTKEVEDFTKGAGGEVQTPFQYSGLKDVFYFVPAAGYVPPPTEAAPLPPPPPVPAPTDPVPVPPDPPVQPDDRGIKAFFAKWWDHQSSDDAMVWASDFTSPCNYCYGEDGRADRAFIAADRQKIIDRYTRRLLTLVDDPQFSMSGDTAKLLIHFDYRYSGRKEATGRSKVSLDLIHADGRWFISAYDEKVVRKTDPLPPKPNPVRGGEAAGARAALSGFVSHWWQHQSSDDATVWAADFRSPCSYCYGKDGKATRAFIMQDRLKLLKRYPTRTLRLHSQPEVTLAADGRTASVKVSYHYFYDGQKSASGTATVSLGLSWNGSSWGISSYDEKTRRD